MKKDTKDVYDVKELSLYLKISISQTRKLVREKRIPYYRIGKCIYFRANSIENWLKNLEEQESINSIFC